MLRHEEKHEFVYISSLYVLGRWELTLKNDYVNTSKMTHLVTEPFPPSACLWHIIFVSHLVVPLKFQDLSGASNATVSKPQLLFHVFYIIQDSERM